MAVAAAERASTSILRPRPVRMFLGLDMAAWGLVAPALIPVLLFSVAPLAWGMYIGFTDATAGFLESSRFTGLQNYAELLTDSYFWTSFRVGLIWAFSVTGLQLLASLGLALLLNADLRFKPISRVLTVVPWAMPPVVVGLMWRMVYHPTAGVLNDSLRHIGIDTHGLNWLSSTTWALPAVVLVGVWAGMPQTTIVILAAIQNVSTDLREAAALDGANARQSFLAVTWPSIQPVVTAITSLNLIWNFNSFGLVYVLTGGGPAGSTRLPMLFAYESAFSYGMYGYSAALGNAMVIIMAGILLVYLRDKLREQD